MALSPKMFLHNIGGRFGIHGTPPAESALRHPIFGLTNFVSFQLPQAVHVSSDMYLARSLSAVTKEQLLEDQFAVEGTFDNPPSEILEAVNAEFATFAATYGDLNGSCEIRRGYGRSIIDGEISEPPEIDDEAVKFFDETHDGFGDDFIAASPNASYWAVLYGADSVLPAGVPGISLTLNGDFIAFSQSKFTGGETVEVYSIDTGIVMSEDPPSTYQLQFQGVVDNESESVAIWWHKKALYIAKHGVWIKPFSIFATRSKSSGLSAIEDAGYELIMSIGGEDAETLSSLEQEEYDTFYEEHPTVVDHAEPHGIARYLYDPPDAVESFTDTTPTATISEHVFHVDFLPVEVV
jgi:hypothetical protein